MKKVWTTVLVILAALALVACGSDGGGGDGDKDTWTPTADTGGEDVTVEDLAVEDVQVPECDPACGAGFACVDGQCVAVVECDPACGAGFECKDGQCVEIVVTCDPACGAGFECIDGQCVEIVVTCDPACGAGFECVDGQCVETVVTCDPACGAGFECIDGQCVETVTPCAPACTAGFECVDGQCVEVQLCQAEGNVKNLTGCTEGPVDVMLTNVLVTYVFGKGFFVQDDSGAMEVYLGEVFPFEAPKAGDVVNLHVTEYGSFKNQTEVTAADTIEKVEFDDVEAAKLDISGGTVPSVELIHRIVKGTGFTATKVEGQSITVNYGTAEGVLLRINGDLDVCVGAVFDASACIIQHYYEAPHIHCFDGPADLANFNNTGCQVESPDDNSNWNFEETDKNDPPADFEKATPDFTATWTAAQAHGGANSCNLTWFSGETQELFSGWYIPAAEVQNVTFTVWVLDNDVAGRIRPMLQFYDENKEKVEGAQYQNIYSEDGPDWNQMDLTKPAPAGTAFVRASVRMYDVGSEWDGDATVFIDDWNLSIE